MEDSRSGAEREKDRMKYCPCCGLMGLIGMDTGCAYCGGPVRELEEGRLGWRELASQPAEAFQAEKENFLESVIRPGPEFDPALYQRRLARQAELEEKAARGMLDMLPAWAEESLLRLNAARKGEAH